MKCAIVVCALLAVLAGFGANAVADEADYAKWSRGPSSDSSYFPIAVWAQNPSRAAKYKAAGVNVYVALHKGPTAEQIELLRKADMKAICHMNDWAKQNMDEEVIIGWMHGDEPDNAQRVDSYWKNDIDDMARAWPEYSREQLEKMTGYGPSKAPKDVYEDYLQLKKADPTRPVLLNLGQSISYTDWGGRGVRTNHHEDYPQYVRGGDIISFDIYPANHDIPKYRSQLYYVPFGVSRLHSWAGGKKIIWQCVEASPINLDGSDANVPKGKVRRDHVPTGREIRNEVWGSIIHGSNGIIYFLHQFKPHFNDGYVFENPKLLAEFTAINKEIHSLASVINSPTIDNLVDVWYANRNTPVKTMAKSVDGYVYVFAAAMRDGATKAVFGIPAIAADAEVEVIGEDRTIKCQDRSFTDVFNNWDVHLYKVKVEGFEGYELMNK